MHYAWSSFSYQRANKQDYTGIMFAYHEVAPDDVSTLLAKGLKRVSRGDKGDDASIIACDRYLDERRPYHLRAAHVSRDDNIYAYLCVDQHISDITDGSMIAIEEFIRRSDQKVLKIKLDPTRCFVSDLDAYDALKKALDDGADDGLQESLATHYWEKLLPLPTFPPRAISRPEIMITYDIKPTSIQVCNP